jgi:hypothetical protein
MAADEVTILLAGDPASLLIPFSGYLEDVDGCEERVEEKVRAALERLPAVEALFVSYVQGDTRPATAADAERAEAIAAAAAGDELHLFLPSHQ